MASNRTFTDKTSAADKSIGFDYQYYYFLDRLLNLKSGESVGLEVLDDVHLSSSATLQLLFQLKHTTALAANGKPVNLASLDDDLWKTMSNWAKVICDPNDGRALQKEQLRFIKRTEFHLVTNKSWNLGNFFINKIVDFVDGQCDFSVLKAAVKTLHTQTTNVGIKAHIADVLALEDIVCERFFMKLRFELGLDEIIEKVKRSIRDKFIALEDVEIVFARLDSNIRAENFINIKIGNSILISYDDFMQRYEKIFVSSRKKELRYDSYKPVLPDNLISQRFVKQLLHIGDVQSSELEIIAEYTIHKLRLARNLLEWQKNGQMVADEVLDFHSDVQAQWKNNFRSKFRPGRMPPDLLVAALDLLDNLREKRFKIAGEELGTEFSNGELYHLSDSDAIGWHPDWENL
jgi:hypothetical protein